MKVKSTLDALNKDRDKVEAAWVFSLWKDPSLFDEYENIPKNFLTSKDAIWYYELGKKLYENGYKKFDDLSIETYLKDLPKIKDQYNKYGGYREIEQIEDVVDEENVDAYYDKILKMNNLSKIFKKFIELFSDPEQFEDLDSESVYNVFETINNAVALSNNEKVESLVVTDDFLEHLKRGEEVGFDYGKYAPILNYITLGAAPGLFMIGGHSGTGKSSFAFENMLMGLHEKGIKTAIISNEMGIKTYKVLLLEHILTRELNYWNLPRKNINLGNYTEEQELMLRKAAEISEEKYNDIMFVRMYSNDPSKIIKHIKRLKAQHGVEVFLYDTFKCDDDLGGTTMWQSLLMDSRKLDSTCRQLGVCCITTYQLALHTTNQRYLDATCLSNAKQIKEVYETMIYMRPLWEDEYTGEKYDVKAYKFSRENKKIKVDVELDKNKKYLLCFVDKTRSDEDKQILVYEWKGHLNSWTEIGRAHVINERGSY